MFALVRSTIHNLKSGVKNRFQENDYRLQKGLRGSMMKLTTAAYLASVVGREVVAPGANNLTMRVGCAIALIVITTLAMYKKPTRNGVLGIVFTIALETGIYFNSVGTADPLEWLLPTLILIPLCSAPLWIATRHAVLGNLLFYTYTGSLLSTLDISHEQLAICFCWAAVGLIASVTLQNACFRLRVRLFKQDRKLSVLARGMSVKGTFVPIPDGEHVWAGIKLTSAFQPLYSLAHQTTVGFEALVRGHRIDGTAVAPPDIFEADPSSDIRKLDHMIQKMHLAIGASEFPRGTWIFINVLPQTFISENYASILFDAVVAVGVDPSTIVIEILESHFANIDDVTKAAEEYREKGFLIAIDDFGAGHSNLDRLLRIQPDIVKLDGHLIRAKGRATGQPLLPHIVSLLHNVGMLVVVEGVETINDLGLAIEANVDIAQGYLLGRPAPITALRTSEVAEKVGSEFRHIVEMQTQKRRSYRALLSDYIDAMDETAIALSGGSDVLHAFSQTRIVHFPLSYGCYLLDANGRLLCEPIFREIDMAVHRRFPEMANNSESRWDNKSFFVAALATPGHTVFTQPYFSLTTGRSCVALARALRRESEMVVFVTKLDWTSPTLPWPTPS
jgi:EAL domain-containing protein (putative c-di-GMP-specific phosphodiesterase class I)